MPAIVFIFLFHKKFTNPLKFSKKAVGIETF